MNPGTTFNRIIEAMEQIIKEIPQNDASGNITDKKIGEQAFLQVGTPLNDRERNVLFSFLLGMTATDYVISRRLNEACRIIIELPSWKFPDRVIEIAGISDQQSFCKKFKKFFHMTPVEAFRSRDRNLLTPPRFWETLGGSGPVRLIDEGEKTLGSECKYFGISRELYLKARLADSLQSFYNLPDMESELAYAIADQQGVSLEESFEYVYNYAWHWIGVNYYKIPEGKDEQSRKDLLDKDVLYLYFTRDLGFNDICRIMTCQAKGLFRKSLAEYDLLYLRGRFYNQTTEEEYENDYQSFIQIRAGKCTDFDYCYYQFLIGNGRNREFAFAEAGRGCNDPVYDLFFQEKLEEIREEEGYKQRYESCQQYLDEQQKLLDYYGEPVSQMERYNQMLWDESDDQALWDGAYEQEIVAEEQDAPDDDFPNMLYSGPDEAGDESGYDDGCEVGDEFGLDDGHETNYYTYHGRQYDLNAEDQFERFCEEVERTSDGESQPAERRMTLYASLRDAKIVSEIWLHESEYIECQNKASYSTFGFEDSNGIVFATRNPDEPDWLPSAPEEMDVSYLFCKRKI